MKMSRSFDRRKDAEDVGMAVRLLRKEARTWFNKKGGESDDVYAKASERSGHCNLPLLMLCGGIVIAA
ncbi:hypothetical protein ACH5RR_036498 [Cinchona calisaya]|uniref:RDRP C-terminal head domain-containing protein n=1 Tax=Cinchona calisaya TaxID=153742 RepID=A0ABD2Y3E5_9GENT